ncbi:MAG: hypothetical protein RI906_215 [Pseudomonadota bacterium]
MTSPGGTQAPLPQPVVVVLLLLLATSFSGNHVAARLAFDNGTSVITAVTVRSAVTALAVFALLYATRAPIALGRQTLTRAALIGLLLSVQSYCLYGAVARLPVALALLTFNTFPLMLALVSWLGGGDRPSRRTLTVMPVILLGLALALDARTLISGGNTQLPLSGVLFGLGASLSFAVVLFLTPRWLGQMDGRLRSALTMAVVAIIVGVTGLAVDGFAAPKATAGWVGLALLTLFYGSAITGLFVLLPRVGAVNNAPIMNLEPITAMLLAWLFLGQTVAPVQMLGAVVVISAIIYLSSGPRPASAGTRRA